MQYPNILKMVETRAHEKDLYWLARGKGLLQSDLWVVDVQLDDRPDDEALLAERDRLETAIDTIEGLT